MMRKKLKEIYDTKKGYILAHNKYKDLREFLIKETIHLDTSNLSERLFVLFNHTANKSCIHCGKATKFQNSVVGYRKYCSNECKWKHIYTDERTKKIKETCLKNHGVENPAQSEKIKQKIKETCLKKHGVDHHTKLNRIKKKMKETCLKNHGVENPAQSEKIKQKIKETCLKKHGVDHNLKIPEVRKKVNQKLRDIYANREFGKFYSYVLPSGKTIRVQGFEQLALDELFDVYVEDNIRAGRKDILDEIGHIIYMDNGNEREYFPDIYIMGERKIIEVKSTYTYNLHYELNMKKKHACLEKGFLFEFWVYDKNKNKIIM